MTGESANVLPVRDYYHGFTDGRTLSGMAKLGCFGMAVLCRVGDALDYQRTASLYRVISLETPFDMPGELEAERTDWDPLSGTPPPR